jgi:hypothetical protein
MTDNGRQTSFYLSSVVCHRSSELLVREEREMKTAVSRNRHFDLAIDLP